MTSESEIIRAICNIYDIDYNIIISRYKQQELVDVRFAVCWFLHRHGHLKLAKIGELIKRHHATVIYGIREYENLLLYNKKTQQNHAKILQALFLPLEYRDMDILINEYEKW